MNNIKKYAMLTGLSLSMMASSLNGCGNKVNNTEQVTISENKMEEEKKFEISDDKFNDLIKKYSIIEIKNQQETLVVSLDYKVYKYNNEKIVIVNPDNPTVDYLTGIELINDGSVDLYPICDLRYYLEDFKIKPVSIDTSKTISGNELLYVFDSEDINKIYNEIISMTITEQTLFKYNSCLAKYNKKISEDDLDLINSEFNDEFNDTICLTNSKKTGIYNKDSINLIYSENGSTIIIGKIQEINGQQISTNFNDILDIINIEPLGYVVDRGLITINSSKYEEMTNKYGKEIMEALDRYGIPVLTYDMDSICMKYNSYKHDELVLSKIK
ncbi:MAG: hypothetical protein E7158_02295 [Firmicutes bacterium]|nr:hypothetical protein [Bacillota bacterium]